MTTASSSSLRLLVPLWVALWLVIPCGLAQTNLDLGVQFYAGLSITGSVGTACQVQYVTNLAQTNAWAALTNLTLTSNPQLWVDTGSPATGRRFYRTVMPVFDPAPTNMVLIPPGSFTMGDSLDLDSIGLPLHTVYVSAFFMDRYEVTKALWDEVKAWNGGNGYSYENAGSAKAAAHPVQTVNWRDCVKWCNARSEKEGRTPCYYNEAGWTTVYKTGTSMPYPKWDANGYRLPTEAEWEKAARGGASGHRFPWSDVDTITHTQANYYSDSAYAYDVSATRGYHPTFATNSMPYTSPVGYFAPNGYGLYDMAGNVWEWCWDWLGAYSPDSQSDPKGPASGPGRVTRGGSWVNYAFWCRAAHRNYTAPDGTTPGIGFRTVLPAAAP